MITTSYVTIDEAHTYMLGNMDYSIWDASEKKSTSLIQATRIIDALNLIGSKTDEDQALEFPRDGETAVPEAIKSACIEIALALVKGVDPEVEYRNLKVMASKYGNASVSYDTSVTYEHVVACVPSVTAWRLLKPYIRDRLTVTLERVS